MGGPDGSTLVLFPEAPPVMTDPGGGHAPGTPIPVSLPKDLQP